MDLEKLKQKGLKGWGDRTEEKRGWGEEGWKELGEADGKEGFR